MYYQVVLHKGTTPIKDPKQLFTECKNKLFINQSSYTQQAVNNMEAYASSEKCSQQTTDTLAFTSPDLPSLTNNNPLYLSQQAQDPHQNPNLSYNQAGPDRAQAALNHCLQNPSSEGCQSIVCGSLPNKNMRHVCHEEGFEFICTQFPRLPECKHITANNSLDCSTLPPYVQEECESKGAIAFCQKHSQSLACQKIAQADSSNTSSKASGASEKFIGGGAKA